MAKGKKKRSRQSLFSKAINAGLILLGLSRPIMILAKLGFTETAVNAITSEATFGLSQGKFNLNEGLKMYTPAGGAIALGKLKQYLMRHFPVGG